MPATPQIERWTTGIVPSMTPTHHLELRLEMLGSLSEQGDSARMHAPWLRMNMHYVTEF